MHDLFTMFDVHVLKQYIYNLHFTKFKGLIRLHFLRNFYHIFYVRRMGR